MIRMLFAMFVTFAGFTAAALWMARGGDAREVMEEVLPAEVRAAAQSKVAEAREAVQSELRKMRDAIQSDVAAMNEGVKSEVAAERDGMELEVAPKNDGRESNLDAAEEATDEEIAEEAVAVHDLAVPDEFVRDLGPADEGLTSVAAPAGPPDQEEWASLIRRMLAVYQRTRAVE
jgi:Skp family chaperone for outer membrane proteins